MAGFGACSRLRARRAELYFQRKFKIIEVESRKLEIFIGKLVLFKNVF